MIIYNQNGSETKTVVKLRFSGELVRLCIPVKHPQMCSVGGSVSRGECSNRRKDTGRTLSRATVTSKGDDLNVCFCN